MVKIKPSLMKTKSCRTISFTLATLSVLVATGCSDREASSSQLRPKHGLNANEDLALKELGAKVGMTFPTNAVLVNSGDGGGREPGFYEWAIYSPSPVKMPPMKATGVKDYLNMPLEDSVKFVQGRMKKQKIQQAESAFDSSWQTNGFGFSGTLVRSAKGDYLVIVRGPL
jgi:hypothetical protein